MTSNSSSMDFTYLLDSGSIESPEEVPSLPKRDDKSWSRNYHAQSEDHSVMAVKAEPLIEVCSVIIHSSSIKDTNPCEIYGYMLVIDGEGASYQLYERVLDDPETLSLGDTLTLTGPVGGAISSLPKSSMVVNLRDRAHANIEIANGEFSLEYMTNDDYEEVKLKDVHGKNGYATVHYVAFPCAVIARVQVIVEVGNDDVTDVCGSIVARYGSTYRYSVSDVPKKYISSTLFKKLSHQPQEVNRGSPVALSRSLVAVPAYSSLIIELNLKGFGTQSKLVYDFAEFQAYDTGQDIKEVYRENVHIQVRVNWFHPFMKFQIEEDSDWESEGCSTRLDSYQRPSSPSDLSICCRSPSSALSDVISGLSLLEVFSVFIGREKNEVLNLYGKIMIRGSGFSHFYIFDRDEDHPEMLFPTSKTASLVGPSESIYGPGLDFMVDLKDASGDGAIKGVLGWGEFSISTHPKSWYDRRICSVIQGVHGYAALHYTIFSDALQAEVKVVLSLKDSSDVCARVHGSLVARYGNHDYSTRYENEYYRSVLFKEPSSLLIYPKRFEVHKIPLSRSVVSVPIQSSLVIDVDMHVTLLSGEVLYESLEDSVEFKIDTSGASTGRLEGKDFLIDFHVEWSKFW